jgi:transcriptional regulator GlxA family with amidase domain
VKRHIEAHLDQAIRVTALADISGLSAGCFSVAFRTTFGSSVRTYLTHGRIERAQMLMVSTGGSLADIALTRAVFAIRRVSNVCLADSLGRRRMCGGGLMPGAAVN